jgi:hypothetical protein
MSGGDLPTATGPAAGEEHDGDRGGVVDRPMRRRVVTCTATIVVMVGQLVAPGHTHTHHLASVGFST